MKRSEMVDKIFEYLKSQTGEYNEVEIYVSTAEDILKLIEKEGMQPPLVTSEHKEWCPERGFPQMGYWWENE